MSKQGTLTLEERMKREEKVKSLIDRGLCQADIARILNISPQAVSKFMKIRGWTAVSGKHQKQA